MFALCKCVFVDMHISSPGSGGAAAVVHAVERFGARGEELNFILSFHVFFGGGGRGGADGIIYPWFVASLIDVVKYAE